MGTRKWSKEIIIEAIKNLNQQNADLSAGNAIRNHVALFTAACALRYFSSWGKAVKAAGIDYEKILETGKASRREKLGKWSKEKVLEEIRRMEPRALLTIYRDRLVLYSAARREFGSWKKALEIAGYRLTKGSYKNSKFITKVEKSE